MRLELTTTGVTTRCSNQLSYGHRDDGWNRTSVSGHCGPAPCRSATSSCPLSYQCVNSVTRARFPMRRGVLDAPTSRLSAGCSASELTARQTKVKKSLPARARIPRSRNCAPENKAKISTTTSCAATPQQLVWRLPGDYDQPRTASAVASVFSSSLRERLRSCRTIRRDACRQKFFPTSRSRRRFPFCIVEPSSID